MAESSPDSSFHGHCQPSASHVNLSLMLEASSSLYALGTAASTSKITLHDAPGAPSPSPSTSPQPSHQQTRHPDFWLYDGSIVLSVQNTLFRVHQTILAKHSEVFADLFTVPQPPFSISGEDDDAVMEGCHVVEMHDFAADFTDLLHAIYHPRYVCPLYLLSICNVSWNKAILITSPTTPIWIQSSPLYRGSSDCPQSTSSDTSDNAASPFFSQNFPRHSRITSTKQHVPPQIVIEATPSCGLSA